MNKSLKVYFYDILQAIDEVESFTKDISWDEFKDNIEKRRAVEGGYDKCVKKYFYFV